MYPAQQPIPEPPRYHPGQQAGATLNPVNGPTSALTAFVGYAQELQSLDKSRFPEVYAWNAERIRELEPLLRVHGILDVMEIRNPEVAALMSNN